MSLQKSKAVYTASERQYTVASEKFKYLGVVFTSDGRRNWEIDTRIGKANAVLHELYRSVVTKRELPNAEKLSVFNRYLFRTSDPHLWSWILGNDRKNIIPSASGRDGIFAKSSWCDTSRQSEQLWNSQSPECRTTSPNREIQATLA